MSEENKNIENDDFIDEAEYQKAIAALESSKSVRLKENVEKKKKEEQERREAQRASRKAEAQKKIEKSGIKNKFIAKCVTDPIIPACIIVGLALIIGLACYILVPILSTPAMKFTMTDFQSTYTNTEIYKGSLSPFGFAYPTISYVEGSQTAQSSVAITADPNALSQTTKSNPKNLIYFNGVVPNNATSLGIAVQGSCRKSDKKVTALRVMIELDPNVTEDYFNLVMIYFGSYFQAIYPNLTTQQALEMARNAIIASDNPMFVVSGDYAYRVVIETNSPVPYVALDIVPAGAIARK